MPPARFRAVMIHCDSEVELNGASLSDTVALPSPLSGDNMLGRPVTTGLEWYRLTKEAPKWSCTPRSARPAAQQASWPRSGMV